MSLNSNILPGWNDPEANVILSSPENDTKTNVHLPKITISNETEKEVEQMASVVLLQENANKDNEEITTVEKVENIPILAAKSSHSSPRSQPTRFYPGDIVMFKEDRRLQEWVPVFGTVLKPPAGSDMSKNSDKGSSTEFHVHWDLTQRISVSNPKTVSLVDRVLLRGQRVENHKGHLGTVVDYQISASVLINGTEDVVQNVPLSRLRPISRFVRGQEVLLDGWVGIITSIKRNVWFRLDGGLTFYIEVNETDGFSRVDPYWGLGVACPGMRAKLPVAAFNKAQWTSSMVRFFSRWLPLNRIFSWNYSTIIMTDVVELEVKWLQTAPGQPESLKQPSMRVNRKELNNLLVIGTPSTETIGINSVRKLKILPLDSVLKYEYWLEKLKNKCVDNVTLKEYPQRHPSTDAALADLAKNDDTETPVKVLLRHNLVTVKWDDGSVEVIPAIKVPKINLSADDGEFPMGLTIAPIDKDSSDGDKYGIVMASIDLARSRSRKVNVRWIIDGKDEGVEEVSVFDIRPHDKYSLYHRGTIVFPRQENSTDFPSAVIVDLNVIAGKMVAKRANDEQQEEVYPHQVIALQKRCHWSFFSRVWVLDDMIPPPYQFDMEFSPIKKWVDVKDQKWDILIEVNENTPHHSNNPGDESPIMPTIWDEPTFELLAFAPQSHRYYSSSSNANMFGQEFAHKVKLEIELLSIKENIPEGIWIRCYENRLDLLSVLMVGPTQTPYEDGLFLFDLQLTADFPSSRPMIHYVSYTHEIHPLLSFDGNVCGHLIPWNDFETASGSYIAFFLGKLQALLFTPTPYFTHPTKKQEEASETCQIKALMYNQNVFIRVLDTLWNMLQNPHSPWEKCIRNHFASAMPEKYANMEKWIEGRSASAGAESTSEQDDLPAFPLLPVSDGMRISVQSRIEKFKRLSGGLSFVNTTADPESFEVLNKDGMDANRMLTPIAEMTEPSSTSTFGGKLSSMAVPSDTDDTVHGHDPSLDSLKNVKMSNKNEVIAEEDVNNQDGEVGEVKEEEQSNRVRMQVSDVDYIK